ncbi:glycosyltransferase 87 family protein [Actinoplanes sp. NPDC049118]|uniref:glycosyltransferase 87 family protein n=1 Tax=Actinoplanes sp. NPDC049118 TaxID=3155769 RepID=UPI003411C813
MTLLVIRVFDEHYRFFDMVIYHDAIRWWTHGGDLYDYAAPVRGHLGFTYPPFAALVLMPVASTSAATAGWLNAAGSIVALAVVLAVLIAPIAEAHGRSRRSVLAVALPLALCTEPVRQTLGLGQVNLWLFALVVLDLIVVRRHASRWTGVGVGVATAVKLTPGLFIVYLLVTRQWRAARTACLTVAALTVGAFLAAPAESVRYFGDLMWRPDRVGAPDALTNQALTGLFARLDAPAGWWTIAGLLVLAIGLHRARRANAGGDEVTALTLTGLTANLISPMSWTHHLVFLPVAVLLLADRGLRRRDPLPALAALAGYALSVASPIWLAPGNALLENAYTLMLIALVVALPATGDDPPLPVGSAHRSRVRVVSSASSTVRALDRSSPAAPRGR